jgi:hypothetical protein
MSFPTNKKGYKIYCIPVRIYLLAKVQKRTKILQKTMQQRKKGFAFCYNKIDGIIATTSIFKGKGKQQQTKKKKNTGNDCKKSNIKIVGIFA